MIFWIGLALVTIVLPLVVLWFRRNFIILLLAYVPPLALTYRQIHPACEANRMSEACTWGYMNYAIALVVAAALYYVLSALQFGFIYLKRKIAK